MMSTNHRDNYRSKIKRRRKALIVTLLLVFVTFLAGTLFGDSGVLVNRQVKGEFRRLLSEKERLAQQNERLKQEILALQTNQRKIEAIGRNEFGFGRPGEIVFYFPPAADAPVQQYSNRHTQ